MRHPHRIAPWLAVATVSALLCCAGLAQAAGKEQIILTGGFTDHLESSPRGRIDWSNGWIIAQGVGRAEPSDTVTAAEARLGASRAAVALATRNALALTKGIRIDAASRVADVKDGVVQIEGIVQGREIVDATWSEDGGVAVCTVTVRVPVWGVEGVALIFVDRCRKTLHDTPAPRCVLTGEQVPVDDCVVVLDARGQKISPCVFPDVIDSDGRRVYDVTTLPSDGDAQLTPVRYVESDLPFEKLQAMLDADYAFRIVPAAYTPSAKSRSSQADKAEPTSKPKTVKRRAKRRIAARLAMATGKSGTQLVLTKADADRLARSPHAASAMRRAQVLVVVDAAAAGTEGQRPVPRLDCVAQLTAQ